MANKQHQEPQPPPPVARRPTITLPPRPTADTLFGSGLSPGPLTLVSSFFAENGGLENDSRSFSQLLAGAMNSPTYPMASPMFLDGFSDGMFKGGEFGRGSGDGGGGGGGFSFLLAGGIDSPIAGLNNDLNAREGSFSTAIQGDGMLKEEKGSGSDGGFGGGYKDSRPMSLAVMRSPLFTVPPGLSPSGLLSPGFFSPLSPFGMSHQQALAHVTAQAAQAQSQTSFSIPADSQIMAPSKESSQQHPYMTSNDPSQRRVQPETFEPMTTGPGVSDYLQPQNQQQLVLLAVDKPAEDGYNWRKYGQKQVKGCEFPRSYYKCTSPSCPVKKKVERSLDGRITEIIYKGQHNHPIPQPNKRGKNGGNMVASANSQVRPETYPHGGNYPDGTESVQETSMQSDSVDPDEVEIETRTGEVDYEDDEPNAKRRNIEVEPSEATSGGHKTVTEPKIIVQTRSEVDLLDDGYRWRKYGQKVVKGNPHPRSYYKCTYSGCNVRKHVERAAADPKAVITTYEGKHNHDLPAARNSSHNMVTASLSQVKPHKVVAEKHPLLQGMGFVQDKRPAVLQLKEEQIAV
ncbi:hypothetical protein MLD38_000210 [Melastoma candidum]|uniref:Uncharacterized protein n=1 Tax=Melastoma candidum TaxID=119954 RepID=A0ACB9S942_9MYRT|nr:hypothetical protein MLD38_000210 [Melastoma candidum]